MEREELIRRRQEIVKRDGPWTAHNVHLGHGVYTLRHDLRDDAKLRRVVQLVRDAAGSDLAKLRVLDLACLEGGYALEFARSAGSVVGIEGRRPSVEKARFAAEALRLSNVEFLEDDVRNLAVEKHGRFDVVLCLGILYHLDAADACRLVESITSVCTRFAVIDTHVGLRGDTVHVHRDRTYRGFTFLEHRLDAGPAERARSLWASLDNTTSFWPTRSSLLNLLDRAGFTSIHECLVPVESDKPSDRITLLAFKGERRPLRNLPEAPARTDAAWLENPRSQPHPAQRRFAVVRRIVPGSWVRLARGALRTIMGGRPTT